MSGIFRVGVLPSGAGMAGAYCERMTGPSDPGYHRRHRRCRVTVWFTVQLDDRPGSLARVATALGERGVNITGHRRRGRGHGRRADAHDQRRRGDARGVRGARARRSRSTTRPAAWSPTRCRSATFGRARPAAARSADRRRACPTPAADTAAIRFDVVDRADVALRRRPTRVAAARRRDPRRWPRSGGSTGDPPLVEIELEVEGVAEDALVAALEAMRRRPRRST